MKRPLVSVIVPVYRAEGTLRRCVDSILAQTLPDIEIVLVNDGSPDRCGEICEEYAGRDPRVKTVHKQNGGDSSARNAGLEHASGRYFTFVDADDWAEPELACSLAGAMERYRPGLAVCSFFRETGEASEPLRLGFEGLQPPNRQVLEFARGLPDAALRFGASWAKLYRRDVADRHGLRFEEARAANEDTHFNFAYIRCVERSFFLDRPLYHYVSPYGRATMTTAPRPRAFEMHERMYAAVEAAIGGELDEAGRRMLNRHYLDKALLVLRMLGNTLGEGEPLRGKLREIANHGKIRAALENCHPEGSQDNTILELLRARDYAPLEAYALGGRPGRTDAE